MKTYRYKDSENAEYAITLDEDSTAIVKQAENDYETAKDYIMKQCYFIWRYGYKSYHMSTQDRQSRIKHKWKSNIPFGYTRSFTDVFASTLSERPIIYNATALDEKGLDNKENIVTFLSTLSDINGFNRESKKILTEGLKTGTFAVRVNYRPPAEPISYMYLYNGRPIEDTYTPEVGDVPYAEHVDVFKIFPDPGTGQLSYITERDVVTIDSALQMFSGLINHSSNKSPLKEKDLIKNLLLNNNSADKTDYGSVRNEVHSEVNSSFQELDTTYKGNQYQTRTTAQTADQDTRVTDNRVEYKYYVTKTRIVLFINNYPVYIGANIYGFIPYVIKPTSNADIRLGVEGIPYLLRGVEMGINGYMNMYLDNVNIVNQPNYGARKGAITDEEAFKNMEPGDIIYTEGNPGDAIVPLEKGRVTDFNVMDIFGQNAQQLTGASEYNLGISARERTATGANATAQASQKRLTPFIESFMVVMSEIAKMQLKMATKFWVSQKKMIVNNEGKEIIRKFQSNKLSGLVNITLELDSMFAAQNELQNKRLIEILNLVKGTGLVKEDELMRQIIQNTGLPTSKIIPDTAPEITTPSGEIPLLSMDEPTPNNAELPTELREIVSPQLNLQEPSNTL